MKGQTLLYIPSDALTDTQSAIKDTASSSGYTYALHTHPVSEFPIHLYIERAQSFRGLACSARERKITMWRRCACLCLHVRSGTFAAS